MENMDEVLNGLKALGANVRHEDGLITILGDWDDKYIKYHTYIGKIFGQLKVGEHLTQILPNLVYVNVLICDVVFDVNSLPNLKEATSLYLDSYKQHPDFLKNVVIKNITMREPQHDDFLKHLKSVAILIIHCKCNKKFLRGLRFVGHLHITKKQTTYFLSKLKEIGFYEPKIIQSENFLNKVIAIGTLYLSEEYMPSLKNLKYVYHLHNRDSINLNDKIKFVAYTHSFNGGIVKTNLKAIDHPYIFINSGLYKILKTKEYNNIIIHKIKKITNVFIDIVDEYILEYGNYTIDNNNYIYGESVKECFNGLQMILKD